MGGGGAVEVGWERVMGAALKKRPGPSCSKPGERQPALNTMTSY